MITISTVCGDPGGANALVPVLHRLASEPDVRLHNFAYNEGKAVLQSRGIGFVELAGRSSKKCAADHLKEAKACCMLSATSLNSLNWERHFFAAARQLALPSLAVLDFWSNYRERFTNDRQSTLIMPDQVALMDERARAEAIGAGLPEQRLVVTGQPAFDDLTEYRKRFDAAAKRHQRALFAVEAGEFVVMFVSQPLRAMRAEYGAAHAGFDEIIVTRELLAALEDIAQDSGCRITLLVRLHPREHRASYDWLRSDHVRILISTAGDSREIAMAADLVVGMNSVLLLEACHLDCVVVSVQPGLRGVDCLPTNSIGASHAVYERTLICEEIEKYLLDSQARQALLTQAACLCSDGCATRRIADLILYDVERSPTRTSAQRVNR